MIRLSCLGRQNHINLARFINLHVLFIYDKCLILLLYKLLTTNKRKHLTYWYWVWESWTFLHLRFVQISNRSARSEAIRMVPSRLIAIIRIGVMLEQDKCAFLKQKNLDYIILQITKLQNVFQSKRVRTRQHDDKPTQLSEYSYLFWLVDKNRNSSGSSPGIYLAARKRSVIRAKEVLRRIGWVVLLYKWKYLFYRRIYFGGNKNSSSSSS